MPPLFQYQDDEITFHHSLDLDPDPNRFYLHVHDKFEIFYLIRGNVTYFVEGSIYPMATGDVILTDRAEAHKVEVRADAPYERISIQFRKSLLEKIDPQGILLRPLCARELGRLNHYPASSNISNAYLQLHQGLPDAQMRLRIISTVLTVLCEAAMQYEARLPEEKKQTQNTLSQRIIRYTNAHMFEPISLGAIAQEFYLSQSQLARIFKKATGSNVAEYIRTKRLVAARERIREGASSADACSQCGFQDYSSFYRAYVAHYGYPPSKTKQSSK